MLNALEKGVKGGVWNAFFTRLGLFSLEHAHTVELQFL